MLRLVGGGIEPSKVPDRALATVLEALARIIELSDNELSVVQVRAASAGYVISSVAGAKAIGAFEKLSIAIAQGGLTAWSSAKLEAVRVISEVAGELGVDVEIRTLDNATGEMGRVVLLVNDASWANLERAVLVKGHSMLIGRVDAVASSTARCLIRIGETGEAIWGTVQDEKLAARLARYQGKGSLTLHGTVSWMQSDWRVHSFYITDFEAPKSASVVEALEQMHEAGGFGWDGIADPVEYIKTELRGH